MKHPARPLIRRAKEGDLDAQAEILAIYEPSLRWVARRALSCGEPEADLLQQARWGLLHALGRYDPELPFELWTYARWWVRVYVEGYANRNRGIVTVGRPRAALRAWSWTPRPRGADGEEDDPEDVRRIRAAQSRRGTDLDEVLACVAGPTTPADEDLIERGLCDIRIRALRAALDELDPRSRDIVERRFLQEPNETLRSIGGDLGISRERVRQLSERALTRLHASLERTLPPEARPSLGPTLARTGDGQRRTPRTYRSVAAR